MTKSKYVRIFPNRWEQRLSALVLSIGMLYIMVVITVVLCWR